MVEQALNNLSQIKDNNDDNFFWFKVNVFRV